MVHFTSRVIAGAAALASVAFMVGVVPASTVSADETDTYRAAYHFTTPDGWMNDPQRPIFLNGKYYFYYLYNADYPTTVGTSWRLATTEDNVSFTDEGVAVPKNLDNGDVWSGSAVIDTNNTAGFGANAIVVVATQPDRVGGSNAQAQFLWYSTDQGQTFQPYGNTPVMANPGITDFRDPKIIWDADRSRWVNVIVEGGQISIWTSSNLKNWQYASTFVHSGDGTLECPDIFQIRADDGTLKWVLAASANGKASGRPNTYAYWVGSFDGTTFTADSPTPQWLDYGWDWYGGVTWPDAESANLDTRFGLAWMNNWDYPDETPTWASDGFNGTDSIVREIRLKKQSDNSYSMVSQPVSTLDSIVTNEVDLGTVQVSGTSDLAFHGDAYELSVDVSWDQLSTVGLQVMRSDDGTRHADIGVFGNYAYVNRGPTGHPDAALNRYVESRSPFDPQKKSVTLTILVDRTTIEVFIDDGKYVHSSQVFGEPGDDGIRLYTDGGTAQFSNLTIRELGSISDGGGESATGPVSLVANSGKCVDRDTGSQVVQLWDCLGNLNQEWTHQADGTLRANGACLQTAVGAVADGSPVSAGTCTGASNQIWTWGTDQSLVQSSSGKCLDLPFGNQSNGQQLQVWSCSASNSNQRWMSPP